MAGDVAGCITKDGYLYIKFKKQAMYAHRLAWVYVHGVWPAQKIDHLDGDKSNNRIANLREASTSQNTQNQTHIRNTPSGLIGVCWNKACKKWQAAIRTGAVTKHLGVFLNREDAYAAYCQAKTVEHPSAPDRRVTL
jgi:hypothetical protein